MMNEIIYCILFLGDLDMYFLLFLATLFVVYVSLFKDNFNNEDIDKVLPVAILCLMIAIVLCILASVFIKGA